MAEQKEHERAEQKVEKPVEMKEKSLADVKAERMVLM